MSVPESIGKNVPLIFMVLGTFVSLFLLWWHGINTSRHPARDVVIKVMIGCIEVFAIIGLTVVFLNDPGSVCASNEFAVTFYILIVMSSLHHYFSIKEAFDASTAAAKAASTVASKAASKTTTASKP
jgi:quinol-cytochrome oxidoreductase complex cytochrome b subunit